MPQELNLTFPDPAHVIVRLGVTATGTLGFALPLAPADHEDLRWYLEVYAAQYSTEVDDQRADGIAAKLPQRGQALFNAAFSDPQALRLFHQFQDQGGAGRFLTISAEHPEILSLPWELLHDQTTFLVHDPHLSIRRLLPGAAGGRLPQPVTPKPRLRLLFVVSRPQGAGFLDPRSEPKAIMDALDNLKDEARGRVEVEFLRPATLDNLRKRLKNRELPPVGILHFDGHGYFNRTGKLSEINGKTGTGHLKQDHPGFGPFTGYLLFEDNQGAIDYIPSRELGELLHRRQVSLVVLSACQSATVGGDDPMGSVAARLLRAGLPAVLAMTHSVLVSTTKLLFEEFYQVLAAGTPLGEALDEARRVLFFNPRRHEVQRGPQRHTIKLQDWFIPALYQAGEEVALLTEAEASGEKEEPPRHNLNPVQDAGFFGRRRELWDLERWFVAGTRRISLTGFGGLGKTYLAEEAGRWWLRTGLFQYAAFVDYKSYQGEDPVNLAVVTLSAVLGENLLDARAATKALKKKATLIILDNLEALDEGPRQELLDAAVPWSQAGESRMLLTARPPDLKHPDYSLEGSRQHRPLPLKGLAEEDALAYFQALMALPPPPQVPPPDREGLRNLFGMVGCHPLSLNLLAHLLKTSRLAAVAEGLEEYLRQNPDDPLLASLNLSLDRVPAEARHWLPRLAVFQGGAMEHKLLEVTGLADWPVLKEVLVATALLRPETIPGVTVPYLHFHPTLAPALRSRLSTQEQDDLQTRHRQAYYRLANLLYHQDEKFQEQFRAVVRLELPNLLAAVHEALAAGEDDAVEFSNCVIHFLDLFGLRKDRALLTARMRKAAGPSGSRPWYLALSSQGVYLWDEGSYEKAAKVFEEVLAGLEEAPSYERVVTLAWLGRCLWQQGHPDLAAAHYDQALKMAQGLPPSEDVKRQVSFLHSDRGNALQELGDYAGAREDYAASRKINVELSDRRAVAVVDFQMGNLDLRKGKLKEAAQSYREARDAFRDLQEPAGEATAWHNLGLVYQRASQWPEAEAAYRQAALIRENMGLITGKDGAANTWGQLASLYKAIDKPQDTEAWYRKALAAFREAGDRGGVYLTLNNLANFLQGQPGRLAEARGLAEEALNIGKTLDPTAAEIWKNYNTLAKIADQEGQPDRARDYRAQARRTYAASAVASHDLPRHLLLIMGVVQTVHQPQHRADLEVGLAQTESLGLRKLVAALRRVLDGDREEEDLVQDLDWEDSLIVMAVLQALQDPESLPAWLTQLQAGSAPEE